MRVMIVLAPKQINSDRQHQGLQHLQSVVSRLTCPVITKPISREQVLHWHSRDHVFANAGAHTHTHTHKVGHPITQRGWGSREGKNGCFFNHMLLASMPVRPVWKHEWAACKSIGTRDLVSSKSSADWHVLHVISCIVLRGERLSFSDWLVKGCFAVVHVCVWREGAYASL